MSSLVVSPFLAIKLCSFYFDGWQWYYRVVDGTFSSPSRRPLPARHGFNVLSLLVVCLLYTSRFAPGCHRNERNSCLTITMASVVM